MGTIKSKMILSFIVLIVSFEMLSAQTLNFQSIPSDKIQLGFSFSKPFYPIGSWSALSGVYELSANIPISSKLNIVGAVPYLNTSYDYSYSSGPYHYSYSFSEGGLGNIFVGVQTNSPANENMKSIFTFGIFLPTADENASGNGLYADYYNFQKFLIKNLGLYFNYAFHKLNSEGFSYGFEVGPNISIPIKYHLDTELLLHYGLTAGYQISKLQFNAEFTGIAIITQDIDDFGDRFWNSFSLGAQWKEGPVLPKIFYKLYLKKELREAVDGVLGIGVSVQID